MANPVTPLEIEDFSGGMTDFYIGADPTKSQLLENVYIGEDRKPTTRPAIRIFNSEAPRVATNTRIQKLIESESVRFEISQGRVFYEDSDLYTEVLGPSGNKVLPQATANSLVSATKWNRHAYLADNEFSPVARLFKDGSTWKAQTLGMPVLDVSGVVLTEATVGSDSFQFVLVTKVSYQNQGVTFLERSAVSGIMTVQSAAISAVNTVTLSNIPVISNGLTHNYDTANIKIEIYRTQANGDVFYYDGEITNGTTTYVSEIEDADLSLAESLYITGGTLDHDAPPLCKYVESVNDVVFYGHVKEDGIVYPNKLRVSNRFQPWSCPIDFSEEFEEPICGLSVINSSLIVFLSTKAYRVDGHFLPDGGGGLSKRLISPTDGCINANGIVITPEGVFFPSKTGFCYTDGNGTIRVNDHLVLTYARCTSKAVQIRNISATFDALNNRIMWAMQRSDTETDADCIFIAHLKFGIKREMCFTVWSGGFVYPANLRPSSLIYKDFQVFIGDGRGYVLHFDYLSYSDQKVSTLSPVADWTDTAILYDKRTVAHDFGTSSLRKWVPWLVVHADNGTSVSLAISASNDNASVFNELYPLKASGDIPWGTYDIRWGDESIRWNYYPLISAKRRFPAGRLRCLHKQIRFTNLFAEIESSEALGLATFDADNNTVTLIDPSQRWPDDVVDYYIIDPNDESERYLITARTSDSVLTCADLGTLSGDRSWIIRGYRKGEVLKLISYIIDFRMIGQSFTPGGQVDE